MATAVRQRLDDGIADPIGSSRPTRRSVGPRLRPGATRWVWVWLAVWLGVAVLIAVRVHASGPAATDPDSQAYALYFDRLVHGNRLEVSLTTTPKPLNTVTHGMAWALTHDWRAITWLTVAAFATAVTGLAFAAARLAGPAAALGCALLAGHPPFLLEVAHGNSIIYAFAGWAVALAAVARTPRGPWTWRVVGISLLAASLARSESWLLLPLCAAVAVWLWRRGDRAGAGWLLLPCAAPLLWCAHDWLLTADWLFTPHSLARYSKYVSGSKVVPPADWLRILGARYAGTPAAVALLVLALVGAGWAAWRRAWAWVAGLALVGVGVPCLFGVYAARGMYITPRFFEAPELAVRMAAAIGAAALLALLPNLLRRTRPQVWAYAAGTAAVLVALTAFSGPLWAGFEDTSVFRKEQRASANAEVAAGALRPLVGREGRVAVPRHLTPRMALELGLPLTRVRQLYWATPPADSRVADAFLRRQLAGVSLAYHDEVAAGPFYASLSAVGPTRFDRYLLTPAHVDRARGVYILRVKTTAT